LTHTSQPYPIDSIFFSIYTIIRNKVLRQLQLLKYRQLQTA